MTVREDSDELTLRAEEVGTLKTYINVNHIEKERWCLPLGITTAMTCQALFKGIEGEDWAEMYEAFKDMSRAVEVKKPKESQKAKAFWKMKAAKEAGEEYYDTTREVALWDEQLKDPIVALDKALNCVENSYWRFRPECLAEGCLAMAASSKVCGISRSGRAFGPAWIQWIVFVHAQRPWSGMCQGSMGRTWRALFLPDTEGTGDGAGR